MTESLLVSPDAPITCPKCAHGFSLREGFAQQALEGIETSSSATLAKLREQERTAATRQQAADRAQYEQRLAESQKQTRQLQAEQLQLREERQKLQDEKETLALAVQRQVDAKLGEREARVRQSEQERASLDKAELLKKIEDMQQKLAEAQQKGQQGSQQLQGEVLELEIEERLRDAFPLDSIEEVKKGQRGGDVLQRIATRTGQGAGTILWEMKRAKDWQVPWTGKLKEDMRACGAALGVLVTMPGALPKDWPRGAQFALYDDVWVTQFATAVSVGEALRAGMIDVQRQRLLSAGKGEKMEALYDYLTSPQFAQKLRAVYDTFTRMRDELESERNTTQQRWARREKQLQTGIAQLVGIGGEIQGLAAQQLPMLELEPGMPDRQGER
jgi:hypothetical protein